MEYLNLIILLSRYIFAGFGIIIICVMMSFLKDNNSISLSITKQKISFIYSCITFFHLAGVSILVGKAKDNLIRKEIIINGLIVFVCITIVLFLLRIWKRNAQQILWLAMFFLFDIGYIMLERLNHTLATKQVIWFVISTSIALILPFIFTHFINPKYKYIYLGLTIVVVILPFIAGSKQLGATNWVKIGPIGFQPSEVGKITVLLYLASLLYNFSEALDKKKIILYASTPIFFIIGCLALQRDLGAALLYYLTFLIILFIGTRNFWLPILGVCAGAIGALLGYKIFDHVKIRVQAWLDPWQDVAGTGYQVIQGLFAIGTWGWFGSGLTRGMPNTIPIVTTDYIFAAICEEFGNIMGIIVLLCYFFIILWTINETLRQQNQFYMLISIGIAALLTIQAFIIIGGVLKIIPLTGITFPFVSYGGTSILVSITMIGLISFFSYQSEKLDNWEKEVANHEGQ